MGVMDSGCTLSKVEVVGRLRLEGSRAKGAMGGSYPAVARVRRKLDQGAQPVLQKHNNKWKNGHDVFAIRS